MASAAARTASTSGRSTACSALNRRARSASASASVPFDAPVFSVRKAFRMTATSMTSWVSAPHAAGSQPRAATAMAAMERPMPAITLWVAMRLARRAMTAASPRRSSRSTVRTTSAASELAVAPRAPMATPTSARASAGASLMPSPTMMVTPLRRSSVTASTFSCGVRSASTASTPIMAPTASAASSRSPVTMTTRVMPSLRSRRMVRAASGRIGSSSSSAPAGHAVDGDENAELAVTIGPSADRARPGGLGFGRHPGRLADGDGVPFDGAADAAAGDLFGVCRSAQRQLAVLGGANDGGGEDVR